MSTRHMVEVEIEVTKSATVRIEVVVEDADEGACEDLLPAEIEAAVAAAYLSGWDDEQTHVRSVTEVAP